MGQNRTINLVAVRHIEAPYSKLQGIFDPQGNYFILIAREPRSKLPGMRSLLDSLPHALTPCIIRLDLARRSWFLAHSSESLVRREAIDRAPKFR